MLMACLLLPAVLHITDPKELRTADVVQQHLSQAVWTNAMQPTSPACSHGLPNCCQEACTLPFPG